jgi:hypothetical protein
MLPRCIKPNGQFELKDDDKGRPKPNNKLEVIMYIF